MSEYYLKTLFDPTSIVLIGASPKTNSIGKLIFDHLSTGFIGKLHLVNPKHKAINGLTCYKSIKQLPDGIELAIVVSPARSFNKIIQQCGEKQIKNVCLLTPYLESKLGFTIESESSRGKQIKEKLESGLEFIKASEFGQNAQTLTQNFFKPLPPSKTLLATAEQVDVNLLGPDAAALVRTSSGLNASINNNTVHKGKLALVTSSKSICNTILDWADKQKIGFSSVICHGMELDLGLSDILDFLVDDPQTNSIIIQLKDVIQPRKFMSALRAAAIRKPVVILKSSHDSACYCDAIAKTDDVHSMDDVFDAAINRAGADRVYTLSNLFSAAKVLATNRRIKGRKLGIISNGQGPTILANDALRFSGIEVHKLKPEIRENLLKNIRNSTIEENTLLISEIQSAAEHFSVGAKAMLASPDIDALAIFLSPDPFIDSKEIAEAIIGAIKGTQKPILAVWLGDSTADLGRHLLNNKKISNYRTPEAAIDAFSFLCTHLRNRERLLQIPFPLRKNVASDIDLANKIIRKNVEAKRRVLSKVDSRQLLEAFHIPCNHSRYARSVEEATKIAAEIGYPVTLKIDPTNITYKSNINGLVSNISDIATLKEEFAKLERYRNAVNQSTNNKITNNKNNKTANSKLDGIDGIIVERIHAPNSGRELMIRIIQDPTFGPVISCGMGGSDGIIFRDRAIQLPPLYRRLTEDLFDSTQMSLLLNNFRNLPAANRDILREILMRISEIACELPAVFELKINPLILDEQDALVIDAEIIIQQPQAMEDLTIDHKHYSHLAIHPYPTDWYRSIIIKNKIQVQIKPIRSEDAMAEVDLMKSMSKESKSSRFMHTVNELTPDMLARFTKLNYDREMAFGAFTQKNNKEKLRGVSRYSINPDKKSCEFAIAIADKWQGLGLASQLMLILIEHVKDRDLKVIEGTVLKNNTSMDKLMESLGFTKRASPDDYDINIYRREII